MYAMGIWKEKSTPPPKKTRDLAGILAAPEFRKIHGISCFSLFLLTSVACVFFKICQKRVIFKKS